ncbi:peroxinectin A-like [Diaphorina citri]|uniref:Peroxinectin A-like n=1 Tax=Diaphorina citri TaxID=121845 RepID=A0A3Q0J4D7_DIACI|nr:peroxinectin A-like [Diaphorina citri]
MAKSTIAKLKSLYKKVDDIDLIVGGIAEVAQDGAIVGPTFRCILAEQFIRTRAGDRFFYDNPGQPSSFTKRKYLPGMTNQSVNQISNSLC